MIGLDTNVIIRYLMADEKKQFTLAEKLIESAILHKKAIQINLVVICEIVWVLSYHYELKRNEIKEFLSKIFHAEHIEVENREWALEAFNAYQNSQADFADCLIGVVNLSLGCKTTYTFDKKASKLAFFTVLN
jgi:predicted nucleic-acid-binding protein